MSSVVVHYGELALKGRNRPWFLHTLVRVIRTALRDLRVTRVRALIGRIIISFEDPSDWPEISARLARLPGIGNFALAHHVPPDLDAITTAIVQGVKGRQAASFRVLARRADKRFPIPSPDIERHVGTHVQAVTGWPVDLSKPALIIRIEVLTDDAFYFFEREAGTGGLPIGTGGKVLTLLSGGIDSPVAAWRLIRRGCRTHFVHFHSYPILSRTSQDKARELVDTLTRFQLRSRLFLVPFGGIQQKIVISVPPPLRVVIYRRMMLRIAEALAHDYGAHALVTGDAVGQVASQTIDNLAVVGRVATLPVLRPLVGMDKEEITADAQRIGTYSISIVPDEDCCTLFTPRFPATRASLAAVERAEEALDIPALVASAIEGLEVVDFRFPQHLSRRDRAETAVPAERES
ncbi:MAG: tRNA uracil 4-sulfurtransferase ThiI [Acidobacteriota bacterium]